MENQTLTKRMKLVRKRNRYPRYDIVLPCDVADRIDEILGDDIKSDTYRVCAYLIFRLTLDGKIHEISSKYLRSIIPNYKRYIHRLVWEEIIITDNKYLCSESFDYKGISKCKGYMLNSKLYSFRTISVVHPKIVDEPDKLDNFSSKSDLDTDVMAISRNNISNFQIDTAKAIHYLVKRQINKNDKKAALKPVDALGALTGIMRIRNGFQYVKTCDYGRIHTNFTCLDSNIKMNCISHVSGEPLVHIDIKNSQPAILYAIMCEKLDMSDPIVNKELELYVKFCMSDLYEGIYLLNYGIQNLDVYNNPVKAKAFEAEFERELKNKFKRKRAKAELIKMLFDEESRGLTPYEENFNLYKTFSKSFPLIYKEILKIKINRYEELAHELQRYESRRILHPLIKYLDSEGVDFISIHDSVIVQEQFKSIVVDKLMSILDKNNVKATLVTENINHNDQS